MKRREKMHQNKTAVCFAGARDNYEVAIALAEVEQMSMLVTDFYLSNDLIRVLFGGALKAAVPRYRHELPTSLVHSVPSALIAQKIRAFSRITGRSGQAELARRFEQLTRNRPDDLLSYAGYAAPAFAKAGKSRRKILFQYHPQRIFENERLRAAGVEIPRHDDPDDAQNILEIQCADAIICASAFTKRSVERVLDRPIPITVAPYGTNVSMDIEDILIRKRVTTDSFNVLFVGSGIPRKGIVQLMNAWRSVSDHRMLLTLVVRGIDSSLLRVLRGAPDNVRVLSNLPRHELIEQFLRADAFAFPSISEGFAHVVPEALALGCYTIASDATCLADLEPSAEVGRVVPSGDADALGQALLEARQIKESGGFDTHSICAAARHFNWARFRADIRRAHSPCS